MNAFQGSAAAFPGGSLPAVSSLPWPPRKRVLASGRHGSIREFVKYHARLFFSRGHREDFLQEVSGRPALRDLFVREPRLFHAPISSFLDRRFTIEQRFRAITSDLMVVHQALGPLAIRQMSEGVHIVLSEGVGAYHITLGMNEINPQEGLWSIAIRAADGERLYGLSFGFLGSDRVLVGSVQGARNPDIDALAFARDFTKTAHGLRPPCFLLEALRALCRAWNVGLLLGIDPLHHVKGRWNQRRKRLKFDYRTFWLEQGARRDEAGYWAMCNASTQRDLSDVPSRKRSMYRRRFELLAQLESHVLQAVRP